MLTTRMQKIMFRWLAAALCGMPCLLLLGGCNPQSIEVTILEDGSKKETETPENPGETVKVEGFGSVVGSIKVKSAPSALPLIIKNGDSGVKDAAVCAAVDLPDESLVVDPTSLGIANVVVFLEKKPGVIKPELAAVPGEPAVFDQKGCRFFPHVFIVRVGQQVLVKSDDAVGHNTHTFPTRNASDNLSVGSNDRKGVPIKYSKPETAPFEVKCDLHTWMKAYHFPVDHPYVGVTDKDGNFKIEGLPAGKHTLLLWHERKGILKADKVQVTIAPDQEAKVDLSMGLDKFAN